MNFLLLIVTSFLCSLSVKSQTINIEFSHFAGKSYHYLIIHGEKQDTIISGELDEKGRASIVFKDFYKGYKGMSRFLLDDGGGLDLVINKENFTVSCKEQNPTFDNIKFESSPENEYFINQSIKKEKLLQKAKIAGAVLTTYNTSDEVYAPFVKEQEQLNEQYKILKASNTQSLLYAARLIEMYDFLMGNSSDLQDSKKIKIEEANTFVISKVNMDDLYTSGYWNSVWISWLKMQLLQSKDESQLLSNLQKAGSRIRTNVQFTAFAELAIRELAKLGKDEVIGAFGEYLSKSKKIENPSHNLLAALGGPKTGMLAPDLVWKEGNYTFDKKQKTILVFYETGCNNCDNEINLLIGNYQELQKKGYVVVTAASDVDPVEYQKNAERFPWKKKFSDFRGQAGYNFISFGVIGTPTIFVIDENGIITGRYARLADAHILN